MVMGIVNITPDSFYDGGIHLTAKKAIDYALALIDEGADIIDIGGESTRPGAKGVGPDEELNNVLPVIEGLAGRVAVPISIDTTKAIVARRAVEAGAEIINDISSFGFDKDMVSVVSETGAAVVLMHMRGRPKDMQEGDLAYGNLLEDIHQYLSKRIAVAGEGGIGEEKIAIDPGLGFGKTREDNYRILRNLSCFRSLNRPIITGVSRKSFTASSPDEGPADRIFGTAAAVTQSILSGSHIIRVHDVLAMKKVALLADSLGRI